MHCLKLWKAKQLPKGIHLRIRSRNCRKFISSNVNVRKFCVLLVKVDDFRERIVVMTAKCGCKCIDLFGLCQKCVSIWYISAKQTENKWWSGKSSCCFCSNFWSYFFQQDKELLQEFCIIFHYIFVLYQVRLWLLLVLDVGYCRSIVPDDPRMNDLHYHYQLERTKRLMSEQSEIT